MFYPPIVGYVLVAVVSWGLARMTARGGLESNSAVGMRTRHSLRSRSAWDAAQRASVPYLIAMAVVALAHLAALLAVQLIGAPEAAGHVLSVSGYVLVVAIALLARRAADRAARRAPDEGPRAA
ncbi:SdpI family protein [Microbacterium indicum]|uniref:SdpI family protein n=1 Tax=Microbacterium indicum TaxID=358100 RepID=UPI000686CB03|nr:SdpI family protein [Microbacterium indicum]